MMTKQFYENANPVLAREHGGARYRCPGPPRSKAVCTAPIAAVQIIPVTWVQVCVQVLTFPSRILDSRFGVHRLRLFIGGLQALGLCCSVTLGNPTASRGMLGLLFLWSSRQGRLHSALLGRLQYLNLVKVSFFLEKLLCNTLMLPSINNSTEVVFNYFISKIVWITCTASGLEQ